MVFALVVARRLWLSHRMNRAGPGPAPHALDEPALVPTCALTRRRFVGAGAVLGLIGCGPNASKMTTTVVPAPVDNMIEIEFGKVTELATPGGMVLVRPIGSRKPFIVMRLEGTNFRVLSSKCTHLGCTVHWDNEEQLLRCPCHGSRFSDDGKVVRGPAKQALAQYESQAWGTMLRIRVTR
jgi:cytochrome b6-f complex iron-sulfur subunit